MTDHAQRAPDDFGDEPDPASPAPTSPAPAPDTSPARGDDAATLHERLWAREAGRLVLMEDCCALIEKQATAGRGLRAATVRASYRSVQKMKPGLVGYIVGKFMPQVLEALEPWWERARVDASANGGDAEGTFRNALAGDANRAADALLAVTDAQIRGARMPLRVAYKTVRGEAEQPVRDAVPGLAEVFEKHLRRG